MRWACPSMGRTDVHVLATVGRCTVSPRSRAVDPPGTGGPETFPMGRCPGHLAGRSRAHRRAMAHSALDSLRSQWEPLAHSPQSRDALAALFEQEPTLDVLGVEDLGELVDALRGPRRRLDAITADRILGLLVAHQDVDPLVAVAVVVALVPGLMGVARRLSWGATGPWGGPECFAGELLTTTWEVVTDWAGRRREYMAPALLSAVRKRLERRAACWRREMGERAEMTNVEGLEGPSLSAAEHLARALEDATEIIGRRNTAVVYARRVLGMTATDLAALTGESRHALDRCLARGERQLCG